MLQDYKTCTKVIIYFFVYKAGLYWFLLILNNLWSSSLRTMFSLRTKNAFKMNQSERKFNYLERIIEGLREPKNLYDVLLPLHFLTKCMGLSPQTHVVTDGKIKYEPSALGVAYGITVMLMFVGK